jgi:hypothetical protein
MVLLHAGVPRFYLPFLLMVKIVPWKQPYNKVLAWM